MNSQAILSVSLVNLSEMMKLGDRLAEIREIPSVSEVDVGESMRNKIKNFEKRLPI